MAEAVIITIGDELLIGQVVDTNSAWMAQELNKAGIAVLRRVAVGDDWQQIWQALETEMQRAPIVLITGGLGPTADDITKPLLCEFFGGRMVVDEWTKQHVIDIFTRLNRPLIERNLKQAEVPDVCTVLPNRRGTAPGMWFEKNGSVAVSMPGVPHEMKGLMEAEVLPRLAQRFTLPHIAHRTLLTIGVGESFLAELLIDFEAALPPTIKLAYLPNYGMVRLRLSSSGPDAEALNKEIDERFATLQQMTQPYLATNRDEPMEAVVARLLQERKATLATAESCTGGYLAHLITSMPGSSDYYWGSVVSYANGVKENLLAVSPNTLQTEGAVSEATVRQMVAGVLQAMGTDYAIAVSGIMGPGGGTAEKPVGLVWIAVGNAQKVLAQSMNFRFDRGRNIQLTATYALDLLRRFILEG
jgi:nicotinamide-nucleotide amidase